MKAAGKSGTVPRDPALWPAEVLLTDGDVRRFESVPLAQWKLPESTYGMLMDACRMDPDKVAIHFFTDGARATETSKAIRFRDLAAGVHQTANLLYNLGVESSDVVSVLMPAVPESQFVLWGAQAAGVVNPVNWMLEPEMLVHMFRAAGTKVLVAWAGPEVPEIWSKVAAVVSQLPNLLAVVSVGHTDTPPAMLGNVRVVDYGTALTLQPNNRLVSGRRIRPDETASLFHTGGTTGAPKLARHLHRNQVFWTWTATFMTGAGPDEVRLIGLPIFHVAGAVVGCYGPLARGATIVLMTVAGYRHPTVLPNLWRIVEAYRATTLTLVPTLVNQALDVPLNGADISSVSYVACSTAPLSRTVADAFYRMTGLHVRESYGMTETTAVTTVSPPGPTVKVGSAGLRLPYQQVRVVWVDDSGTVLRNCDVGEAGLVIVRGPAVFPGYHEPGGARWIEGDWLDTGDIGRLDADGWLWITGRAKDLIIRGGHNIDPGMVEEVMYGHPAVREVAVVGAPDAHAGEVPVAYVVLKPGSSATEDELMRHARDSVPERAAVPKRFHVVEDLPKTQVGKVRKHSLRLDATMRVFQSALQTAALTTSGFAVEASEQGAREWIVRVIVPKGALGLRPQIDAALMGITVPYEVREAA